MSRRKKRNRGKSNNNQSLTMEKRLSIIKEMSHYLYHKSSQLLLDTLEEELNELEFETRRTEDYVYAPGDIPILLVGHTDTVFSGPPEQIYYTKDAVTIFGGSENDPYKKQGLGADDRAGIWGIMHLLKMGYNPHVLFTDQEECGGIGASAAARELNRLITGHDVHLMIELDRRGDNDCVFYCCDNKDAVRYVEKFGFKESFGSFTDISFLMPEFDIAGVNLSIGYYGNHTSGEFVQIDEAFATVSRVHQILMKPPMDHFPYWTESRILRRHKHNWSHSNFRSYAPELAYELDDGEEETEEEIKTTFIKKTDQCPECRANVEEKDDLYYCEACGHGPWMY